MARRCSAGAEEVISPLYAASLGVLAAASENQFSGGDDGGDRASPIAITVLTHLVTNQRTRSGAAHGA